MGNLRKQKSAGKNLPVPRRMAIRQGFVYERVPHITLKSIANNAEIDVIWEKRQEKLEPSVNNSMNPLVKWEEWEPPTAR